MAEKLVMVDKEKLAELRAGHATVVDMCRRNDSLASAWALLGAQSVLLDTLLEMLAGGAEEDEAVQTLTIPIRRRDEPVSAAELETKLRAMGWTEEQLTPDLRAALSEIADNLNTDRQEQP